MVPDVLWPRILDTSRLVAWSICGSGRIRLEIECRRNNVFRNQPQQSFETSARQCARETITKLPVIGCKAQYGCTCVHEALVIKRAPAPVPFIDCVVNFQKRAGNPLTRINTVKSAVKDIAIIKRLLNVGKAIALSHPAWSEYH